MGWEVEGVGRDTNRDYELHMIDGIRRSFKEQSVFDLTQTEAHRLLTIKSKKDGIHAYYRSQFKKFLEGCMIGAVLIVPLTYFLNRNTAGVPQHFVPKVYLKPLSADPLFYARWRRMFLNLPLIVIFSMGWTTIRTREIKGQDLFYLDQNIIYPYETNPNKL